MLGLSSSPLPARCASRPGSLPPSLRRSCTGSSVVLAALGSCTVRGAARLRADNRPQFPNKAALSGAQDHLERRVSPRADGRAAGGTARWRRGGDAAATSPAQPAEEPTRSRPYRGKQSHLGEGVKSGCPLLNKGLSGLSIFQWLLLLVFFRANRLLQTEFWDKCI